MTDELGEIMLTVKLKELTTRAIIQADRLKIATDALQYISTNGCSKHGCTCLRDTAHFALKKIEPIGGWTATVKLELE